MEPHAATFARPFFLTMDGLWFALFLVLGHVLAAGIVLWVRRRCWNDFAAIMIMSGCVLIAGVAGIGLNLWYFHSWGFGVFMGTVFALASNLGRPRSENTQAALPPAAETDRAPSRDQRSGG